MSDKKLIQLMADFRKYLQKLENSRDNNLAERSATGEEMVTRLNNKNDGSMPNKKELAKELANMSISRTGTVLTVPEHLSLDAAISALSKHRDELENVINLVYDYELTIPEGAIALFLAMKELYGFVDSVTERSMWGDTPPTLITVQTGENTKVQIPWGKFQVPGVEGDIHTSYALRNGLFYFRMTAKVKGKNKAELDRLDAVIRSNYSSIYSGKVIKVNFMGLEEASSVEDLFPQFVTVDNISTEDVILSDDVEALVSAALYTPITHTQFCRDNGISLKRGILLEGPYGVGKTLTATAAANLAQANGWTFIYVVDIKQFRQVFEFAKHHQPAVIFAEDLDGVMDDEDGRTDKINEILNVIDGVDTKGLEILTICTTNNVEGITQAMLRPGRFDAVVPVRPPDAVAVQRLIKKYAGNSLESRQDLSTVASMLNGKLASVVREVVERSKLHAIGRLTYKGQPLTITAGDLEKAALGMEAHNALLEPEEADERSDLEKAADILVEGFQDVLKQLPETFGSVPRTLPSVGPQSRPNGMAHLPPSSTGVAGHDHGFE